MNAKDAIRSALTSSQRLLQMFVSDLSDQDLLVRPVAGANHIAWQLGHLILSEVRLSNILPGAVKYPELPAGFAEQHNREAAAVEPPRGFKTKAEYSSLSQQVRETTLKALDTLSEADLDRPTFGDMAQWAPTIGAMLLLGSNHDLMHAGQFSVVRRKLGKPILF